MYDRNKRKKEMKGTERQTYNAKEMFKWRDLNKGRSRDKGPDTRQKGTKENIIMKERRERKKYLEKRK